MKNWSEYPKAGITTVGNATFKAIKAGAKAVKQFWGECCKAENIVAAARAKEYQEDQRCKNFNFYLMDYERVSKILCDCLSSNYAKCGLSRPLQIEDVFCDNPYHAIQVDENGSIIFRFEVDRACSNLFDGGMKRVQCPKVDTAVIEDALNRNLPKFAYRRNDYYWTDPIRVDDISGNRVRIEIQGLGKVVPQI